MLAEKNHVLMQGTAEKSPEAALRALLQESARMVHVHRVATREMQERWQENMAICAIRRTDGEARGEVSNGSEV